MSFEKLGLDEVINRGKRWGKFFLAFDDDLAQEYDFDYLVFNAEHSNSDYWIDVLNSGIDYCLESGMKVPDDLIQDARSFLEDNPANDSVGQEALRLTLQKI